MILFWAVHSKCKHTPIIEWFLCAQSYPINTMTDDTSVLSQLWLDKLSTTQPNHRFSWYIMVPLKYTCCQIYLRVFNQININILQAWPLLWLVSPTTEVTTNSGEQDDNEYCHVHQHWAEQPAETQRANTHGGDKNNTWANFSISNKPIQKGWPEARSQTIIIKMRSTTGILENKFHNLVHLSPNLTDGICLYEYK